MLFNSLKTEAKTNWRNPPAWSMDWFLPVESPPAMQICQWGSNTGKAASQPAVDFCVEPTFPQP